MVIWRGICLVDPLWPSTLHLHTQLRNKSKIQKRLNDKTPTEQIVIPTVFAGEGRVKLNQMQDSVRSKSDTLTSRWSVELHHKLIEALEDGDLMLALDANSWLRKRQRQQNKTKHSDSCGWRFFQKQQSCCLLCFRMFYKVYLTNKYVNVFHEETHE